MTLRLLALGAACVVAMPVMASAANLAQFTILHQFPTDYSQVPTGFLSADTDGTIYGTAFCLNQSDPNCSGSLFSFVDNGFTGGVFVTLNSALDMPTALAINKKAIYVGDVDGLNLYEVTRKGTATVVYQFNGGNGNQDTGPDDPNTFGPFSFDAEGNLVGAYYYADVAGHACTLDGQNGTECGAIFQLILPKAAQPAQYANIGPFLQGGSPPLAGPLAADGTIVYVTQPNLQTYSGAWYPSSINVFNVADKTFHLVYDFQSPNAPPASAFGLSTPGSYPVGDTFGNYVGLIDSGRQSSYRYHLYRVSAYGGLETTLHSFPQVDYSDNTANHGLTVAPDGTIYGSIELTDTAKGFGPGFIFEYSYQTGYHVLYQFTGAGDGFSPIGQLLLSPSGELYGVARNRDKSQSVIFKLTP